MTILQRAAAASREIESNAGATAFASWAIALARAARTGATPLEAFKALNPRSAYLAAIEGDLARQKAAVDAGTSDGWGGELVAPQTLASAFVAVLRPQTVLGRLAGARRVPTNVRAPRATSGSAVGWVGENKPIPASALAFDAITIDSFKISGLVFATRELVELSTPAAAGLVRDDLLAGVAAFEDAALLDPTAVAQAGISPASVTSGAQQIASAGTSAENALTDIGRLIEALYGCNLIAPYFIMRPLTAAKMALLRLASGGGYAFPGLGPLGGSILGIPVLTSTGVAESDASPQTSSIVMIDASELIVADSDELALDVARHAAVQADSAPDDPVTASTVLISLWQQNLYGWRVVRPINWTMRRAGCVATLTGVNY